MQVTFVQCVKREKTKVTIAQCVKKKEKKRKCDMNNQESLMDECVDAADRIVAMAEVVATRARTLTRAVERLRTTLLTVSNAAARLSISWDPREELMLSTLL